MLLANDDLHAAAVEVTVDANGNVTTTDVLDDYWFLPGRPGGQTANGGSNAGDDLVIQANAVNPDDNTITLRGGVVISLNNKTNAVRALNIDYGGAVITGANPEVTRFVGPAQIPSGSRYTWFNHTGAILMPGGGVPFVLFNIGPTWQLQAVKAGGQIFFFAPVVDDDGVARTIGFNIRSIILAPILAPLTAGSVGTLSGLTAIDFQSISIDATWNPITLARFIAFSNPAGSHAVGITDLVGIDVPDTITKPTNVFTIRNLEDRAKMVHRGAAVFGDLGTTVPAAGIELEVRSTIGVFVAPRLTNAQIAALPAVPDGSQVYCTDVGALVIGMHQMLGGAWVAM